jgi:preprotein translocase subunit SecF
MLNILGKRYFFFALSLIIIIPGMILLAINGLPLAIDFKGGTLLELQFSSLPPSTAEIVGIYSTHGIDDPQVQTSGEKTIIIRSSYLSDVAMNTMMTEIEKDYGQITIIRADTVGPAISQQVTSQALLAVAIAALAVVIYIFFAFRKLPNALRYGICAIAAMFHDILIVLSLTAFGGQFFGWQVDSLYLTALLTVIGFSTQDKIVVFDRIRENSGILRKLPYEKLVNHSIVQTLQRSINTQLMTVEFILLAVALFGGVTLREFAVVLLVGLFSGTYSSIFIAAPILVVWENQEWKNWFKAKKTSLA